MRWDEESDDIVTPQKGYRPALADSIDGPETRFRRLALQKEIDRRVAIYTQQVEQTGRITWLPRRRNGD